MTTENSVASNPFMDPRADPEDNDSNHALVVDATLAAGRNVSLTLGTDSLIVLDEAFEKRDKSNCCGVWLSGSSNTRVIPFYNILWVEWPLGAGDITIHYALSISKTAVRASTLSYAVAESDRQRVAVWITRLLDRAYGKSQKKKRAKVLINPHSGKGSAEKWYYRDVLPILSAAKCSVEMVKTKYRGEATDIAAGLDVEAYDMIVSCSGDGLPHEVFNGLGKRADAKQALRKVAVVHVPCGSGNAMSCNLNGTNSPSLATLAIVKGVRTPLDLISITQGNTRTISFLSQSVGIVAESDLATEHLRWLGSARFTYGFLIRLLRKTVYPCDIAIKYAIEDKAGIREHYRRELENQEPASERWCNLDFEGDASASTDSGSEEGLPPLRYGTINDKLPKGWEMVSYDRIGNFYCGNMAYMAADFNFFSSALPNDGFMDLLCIDGDISRLTSIRMLAAVEKGKLFDMPLANYRKIVAYRIIPKSKGDGYISIDGERVPFQPFQAEIHRGLGTTLSKTGRIYEALGPV